MIRTLVLCLAMLSATLLAACGSSPKSAFYLLGPDAALIRDGPAVPVHVVVGPVTIPDLVDRPQIVTRLNPNEVAVNEFARWAAPLKSDIARAIAADVGTLLGSEHVGVFDTEVAAWRVRVDVMVFESVPGESVTLDARWTVRAPGKVAPATGRTVARERVQGGGYDALVAAHDRALATVSRDIASAVRAGYAQAGRAPP